MEKEKSSTLASLYEWIEAAVFSLVCVTLVFTFLFRIVGVDGRSMQNTLLDGDRLILTGNFYTPQRGDIVVINRYTNEPLIKRVIATEGDTLDIDPETHQVILNGQVLDEPYLDQDTPPREFKGPVTIQPGHVFVMGDNRGDSKDSRFQEVGQVLAKDIMGKAVFRLWPLSHIGGLYD